MVVHEDHSVAESSVTSRGTGGVGVGSEEETDELPKLCCIRSTSGDAWDTVGSKFWGMGNGSFRIT